MQRQDGFARGVLRKLGCRGIFFKGTKGKTGVTLNASTLSFDQVNMAASVATHITVGVAPSLAV
jgi:hypothetical protein